MRERSLTLLWPQRTPYLWCAYPSGYAYHGLRNYDLQHLTSAPLQADPGTSASTANPAPASDLAPAPMSAPAPEPRVPIPERFRGDRKRFKAFKNACMLYLALQPRTFNTETVKVGFIISLLTDDPQAWAHNLLELKSPILTSTETLFEALGQLYDDPQRTTTAEAALRTLYQGRRPAEDYTVDFRRWAMETGWNEAALKHQYRQGLSESLKDELARLDSPTTLEGLIQLTIKMDRRLRERKAERTRQGTPTWMLPRVPPVASMPPTVVNTPNSEGEPMQLGLVRTSLTLEERQRRRQANLCLYCGGSGHFLRSCPVRPSKRLLHLNTNFQMANPSQTHLTLHISLQVVGEEVRLPAIIDSGACSCFLDVSTAQRLRIPLQLKQRQLQVHLADGSFPSSGPVTHETTPLLVTMDFKHQELLKFDVISSPLFPVILGLPWLQAHDPVIKWTNKEILFSSDYCTRHCLIPSAHHSSSCLTLQTITTLPPNVPERYKSFMDVFDKRSADQLPPHRPYDCPIELLPGAEIPFGRIFPLSEKELETLRLYITENLEKGFIRPSSSPAGAGLFFVEKKDGTLRPCIDYRDLNKITVKNRYPLPLIPELFQRLRTAQIFTKLDLRGAYNLVRIREGDEWKTAFRTRFGHYEYLVMPFGLCNAPATFQHLVNDVFREFLDHFVIVYLDDILVFSSSLEAHALHVTKVLTVLRQHGLFIKAEKCEFDKTSIQFLGLIISTEGISMDPQKVQAILDWPAPSDKKGVQRFIGFANFYRRFIKGFSALVSPITQLTRQQTRFRWSQEAQSAFEQLKTLFTSAPILQHPDPTLPFVLEVDASEVATGAVLSQRQGSKSLLHPIAFASRKLTSAERNYDVGDRELLAIKFSLEEWRYLLEGAAHPILIFTDHRNLEYLRTAKRLRPRQARWALFFARFCFHISYRPGSKNIKADALSRMYLDTPEISEPETILSTQNFLLIQPDLKTSLLQASEDCSVPANVSLTRQEGLLWFQNKVFIPQPVRLRLLQAHHDHKLSGHFGVRKTLELLQRSYWWPKMTQDCKDFVSSCTMCQRSKGSTKNSWGLLRPLPAPDRPWKEISLDFIVELPPSEGFTTILVVVDRLSKMAHFVPMVGTPSAAQTAETFIKEIVRLHGVPSSIVSDRGVQFTSHFWRSLCKSLTIELCLSSAYHPQSNGQTERTNQTLEQYLRCFCSCSQTDWASLLPCSEFAYNNSSHSTTNQSPFWANYGFHPSFLPDLVPENPVPAVQEWITALQQNFRQLQVAMKEAQEGYKKAYDKGRKSGPAFLVGDKVWLSTIHLRLTCPSRKLGPKFIGPFEVKRLINPVAFELALPNSYKIHPVFHISLLKPVIPNVFPEREEKPPPPIKMGDEEEFEVEDILDYRKRGRQTQYLIKWKGYPQEDNSWEPAENVHAPRLIRAFQRLHPEKVTSVGIRRLPLGRGHCQGQNSSRRMRMRRRDFTTVRTTGARTRMRRRFIQACTADQ